MIASRFKPLDFGAHGVTGSVDAAGRLIALNTYSEQYGYVTLTSADPFPEAERYNPAAVRAYRDALGKLNGYGVTFNTPIADRTYSLLHDAIPQIEFTFAGGSAAKCLTWAAQSGAVQEWHFQGELRPVWRGHIALQRSAYTQLTEGGVLPMPRLRMNIAFANGKLTIFNPELKCSVAILGFAYHDPFNIWTDAPADIELPLLERERFILAYGIGESLGSALESAYHLELDKDYLRNTASATWQRRWANISPDPMVRRGLVYGAQMCIPADDGVCILTDHMLLPLSWNRDAYYVALALLNWHPDMHNLVRRHLIWMFEIAERPDGDWARCYLVNGKVKDHAYQLDQQLFPLLQLADYVEATGDTAFVQRLRPHIAAVIAALKRRRDPHTGLFATEETPADDPIPLPLHLSSHILLWHTLCRVHVLAPDLDLENTAVELRAAIDQHFITNTNADQHPLYAYATDGQGHYHFYHDANDFPLILAPVWGFCAADDPVWRATIDFAFSSQNPAVYDGRLGSVHTPAPWALGDLQDVLIGQLTNDPQREAAAWNRLHEVAQIDGGLPEAYDAKTGAVISRYWFAWTNAVAACIMLGCFPIPQSDIKI